MKFYIILLCLISFSGYSQVYTMPLKGKSLTVKTCTGRVYDNGGKSTVIPNSNGSITIVPALPGKIIKLELDTLDKYDQDTLLIYQGSSMTKSNLCGMPQSVFRNVLTFYGSEQDGSITILYKAKKGPWAVQGFSAAISCIDKSTVFDLKATQIKLYPPSSPNALSLYLYIATQKELAPTIKVNVYYSKDKVLDKSDVAGEPLFISGLSNIPFNYNGNPVIPSEVKAGDYYIIVQFDPDNFITETNEENNVIVSELYTIK